MLSALLLLSLTATLTNAGYIVNCDNCVYYNGIGYIKSDYYCAVYFMCVQDPFDPYLYSYEVMCCPDGLTFDPEHQTCNYPTLADVGCYDVRNECPNTTFTRGECPYSADPDDTSVFVFPNGVKLSCPEGQEWKQDLCSCQGSGGTYCDKVLSFEFKGTYDSWTCGTNFAKGVPYNNPSLDGDVLCLNGYDEFLSVPYLNNYFAWNPIGKTFTLCFWFSASNKNDSSGLLSSNCHKDSQGTISEFCLENGELVVTVGFTTIYTNIFPSVYVYHKVCVTFDFGYVLVYYDGNPVKFTIVNEMPANSQVDTTLGYVKGKDMFKGYIDDFCFWNTVKSPQDIYDCYYDGPSNDYF